MYMKKMKFKETSFNPAIRVEPKGYFKAVIATLKNDRIIKQKTYLH
jgi:hypothetical protein